ncbi:hypothetical protein TNCV_2627881 [Trichonephila clavipes]|nr:hypothetical protein TNCV_2627881 [Trichonephila clavipes]
MKTRLQKTGESLQEYASEVERLTNLAFYDHPATVHKVISLQYFRGWIKRWGNPEDYSIKAGVLIASSVVDLSNSVIPVRMANISDRTRTIQEGEVIAAYAPVTCVDRK